MWCTVVGWGGGGRAGLMLGRNIVGDLGFLRDFIFQDQHGGGCDCLDRE